jgi:hypothetical protein
MPEVIPPDVRILPMDLNEEEFRGKSAEQVQADFFLGELPSEARRGRYAFKRAGLKAKEGTVVLFQFDNRIIASATLDRAERLSRPRGEYRGNLYFKPGSIRVFDPVGVDRVSEIWPIVKRFNRAKYHLPPSRYPEFQRGLTRIRQPRAAAASAQAQDLDAPLRGIGSPGSGPRTTLLQRLCWNSNTWRGPTGDSYQKEDSYVGQNGFGHEEWNLNTADLIDGNVYGYTYYNPPAHGAAPLGPYDLYFFAISPHKERFLVGAYRSAWFLDQEDRRLLKTRLEGSPYLVHRAKELVALGLPHLQTEDDAMRILLTDFALNVRTAPDQVVTISPPRLLRSADIGGRDPRHLNRYTKPLFIDRAPVGESPRPAASARLPEEVDRELLEDAYVRFTPAQRRVIERRHNVLSNRFRTWLGQVGATEIVPESARVDVRCAYSGHSYLFELKTSYRLSTRHALREALGQILEYALYPGRAPCDRLAIVVDAVPSASDIEWFHHLVTLGVAVELFWLLGESVYSASATGSILATKALAPTAD